jgi:hypothetical protein
MTSMTAAIARQANGFSTAASRLQRERRFFTGMAIAMALVCFAGFAPSYYLKAQFGTPPLKPLVHVHGIVFTLWMVLLVVQTALVAQGRVALHRGLGMAGAVLAVLMVVLGAAAAIGRGQTITPGVPQEMVLAFLAIPATALVLFPSLVGAAVLLRQNAAAHKRLIMIATTVILTAAVHRLLMRLVDPAIAPPYFFGATDLFIVAIAGYDIVTRKRVHAATIGGGLAVILSQPLCLVLAGSKTWLTFAHWATGT